MPITLIDKLVLFGVVTSFCQGTGFCQVERVDFLSVQNVFDLFQ